MRLPLILLLSFCGFVVADEAQALRKIYAERDQELRARIEAAEDELAKVTQQVARLKLGLAEPENPEVETITVEVRDEGIFVGGTARTAQELQDLLRAVSAIKPDFHVRLTSASDTDWSTVLPALKACYDAKIWNFDFQLTDEKK